MKHMLLAASVLMFALSASAHASALPFENRAACMKGPLAQFGQYAGDWKLESCTDGGNTSLERGLSHQGDKTKVIEPK
ncbi:MAG: hypothetical protein QNJ14_03805 [Woeseiaceae bacterium]|nr:hypothetical protein [Woeseiaceae bacterium]